MLMLEGGYQIGGKEKDKMGIDVEELGKMGISIFLKLLKYNYKLLYKSLDLNLKVEIHGL